MNETLCVKLTAVFRRIDCKLQEKKWKDKKRRRKLELFTRKQKPYSSKSLETFNLVWKNNLYLMGVNKMNRIRASKKLYTVSMKNTSEMAEN